jgi:hypothetical protein
MGWTFIQGATKQKVIEELNGPGHWGASFQVLDYTVKGNTIWQVVRNVKEGRTFIVCALLEVDSYGWGYKTMSESMHPYYYDCPLKYLDMAPPECQEWRAKVRAFARGAAEVRTNTVHIKQGALL